MPITAGFTARITISDARTTSTLSVVKWQGPSLVIFDFEAIIMSEVTSEELMIPVEFYDLREIMFVAVMLVSENI